MKKPLKYGNKDAVWSTRDEVEPRHSHTLYAERVSYLLCAFVFLGLLIHLLRLLRSYRPRISLNLANIPVLTFLTAVSRMFGYRQFKVGGIWLGQGQYLIISGAVYIGILVWCLAVWPYYRTSYVFGAPPVGLRSGMMAAGMYPFLFAMALKFNPISLLTGLSHAHLQMYHRAISMLAFILGVIHTGSYINSVLRESGMPGLKELWYRKYDTYWSGTIMVFVMLWMCLSSLGVFRKMSYEFFVVQHITSAALFLGFSFVHFHHRLNAHIWLWFTLGIWLLSISVRSLMVLISSKFFCGPRATVRVLTKIGKGLDLNQDRPAKFVRLSFVTPIRWHAGQHFYVRFPGIYPWQAHPFTCLSTPSASPKLPNTLVLLASVGQGITRQLYERTVGHGMECDLDEGQVRASSFASTPSDDSCSDPKPHSDIVEKDDLALDQETREITAYLDGPYGHNYSLGMYEHAMLVAAGTGITFSLPQVMELMQRSVNGDPIITKSVCLIWVIQSFDMIRWVLPEMQQLDVLVHQSNVPIQMHVYAYRERVPYEENVHDFLQVHHAQRVDIAAAIDTEVSKAIEEKSKTMCILSCASKHIVALVGNKVSSLNAKIAMGQLATLRDVRFVPELFSF